MHIFLFYLLMCINSDGVYLINIIHLHEINELWHREVIALCLREMFHNSWCLASRWFLEQRFLLKLYWKKAFYVNAFLFKSKMNKIGSTLWYVVIVVTWQSSRTILNLIGSERLSSKYAVCLIMNYGICFLILCEAIALTTHSIAIQVLIFLKTPCHPKKFRSTATQVYFHTDISR